MKSGMLKSDSSRQPGYGPRLRRDERPCRSSEKGIVLVAVLVFTLILTLLGFSVLSVANSEIALAQKDVDKTKAFYLAEAGLEIFRAKLSSGEIRGGQSGSIEGDLGEGNYRVDYYSDGNAIATGMAGGQEE